MAGAMRLTLKAAGGGGGGRARALPKLAANRLGVGDADVAKLRAKLPLAITLIAMADAEREALVRALAQGGLAADATPATSALGACRRHPAVQTSEVCPRCRERRACPLCLLEDPGACARCFARDRFWTRFRNFRIAVLLAILGVVALGTFGLDRRIADWHTPLAVAIVPVIGDPAAAAWARALTDDDVQPVADFLQAEAARYGVTTSPLVRLSIARAIDARPPDLPDDLGSRFDVVRFTLGLRVWDERRAWSGEVPSSTVRIYVVYLPSDGPPPEERSMGMKRGHVGVVRTRAGRADAGWTQVVIAHELLHTVGAQDHYDANGLPIVPDGLADPTRVPLYPQFQAEIMAGTLPSSPTDVQQAHSLAECSVGPATAHEIHWR